MGPGYAGMIASRLLAEQPEKGHLFINRGISGHRIVDLYARWKADALNFKPDILSLLIGVNDTGHEICLGNGVEPERFEKFYRMLLDWTLEVVPDVKLILMEPFVFPFGSVDERWLPELSERQEIVRRIAADYSAFFIPLQSIFNSALSRAPQEYWMVDGIHPTPAGHYLIAQNWLKITGLIV